ncbi:MAG: hypothetical protein U1G07_08055 [Verrucomicrobiota bacterium]
MRKLIFGLVGLNVVLAGYLAVALAKRSTGNGSRARLEPGLSGEAGASNFRTQGATGKGGVKAPATPAKFSWASLASKDLHKYAANLREAGCPEETIKEIMMAEVKRLYGPREHALKVRPDDIAPWEKQPLYDRRSGETKLRQLLEEKRALLKELTGVDVGIDMPSRLAGRDLGKFETAFNTIPDAARDQVRAIQENYWAQSDDIKQRTMGYLEPEDREAFARIKQERHDALAKVLTPRELQDFEMATSDTASALRSRLKGSDISDDEMRKVFDFMQPLDDQYSLSRRNPDPENQAFTDARTQAEKSLEDQIRSVLGDDRYAEFQRNKDPIYKTISQVGAEAGAPKESIVQAYQAQQQWQADSKRIMQDPNLTQEERMQSLQGIRTQAEQTMQQLFGDKGAKMMQRLPSVRLAERYGASVNATPIINDHAVENILINQ